MLATLLAGLGVWAFIVLPIDAYPDISSPQVQIIVKAPGMAPMEVEARITRPLEVEVRGIPRRAMLRSTSKYALSSITVDFREGTDIYWARQQVSARISQLLGRLPPGVEGGLAPITSPLSELYMFMVEGEGYSQMELRTSLDWLIRPRLLTVDGVAEVNALGGQVKSYHVLPDPNALLAYGLGIDDVEAAIRANNRNVGGDRVVRGEEVLLVRSIGRLGGAEELEDVTVAVRGGIPIHVRELATVRVDALTRYGGVTWNGKGEGVQGLVLLRRGANGRATVNGVKEKLKEIQLSLPTGVHLTPVYDRSVLVERAVDTVSSALGQAMLLVLVVLALFLGNFRSAITAGIVLPLAVLGALLVMHIAGISANLMSFGGLTVAIGILVDASVVVVENIHNRLREGPPGAHPRHLVFLATKEVAAPVLSGVVIIVVSFLPIYSLSGIEGKLFRPLAVTISVAVTISLVLALTVIPVTGSFLMNTRGEKSTRIIAWLEATYRRLVALLLTHRAVAITVSVGLLMLAGAAFPFIGREFMPVLNEGTFVIQTEKLPSISLAQSLKVDQDIQSALMALPEIEAVASRVGSDELRLDPMGLHETDCFIVTRPRDEWTVDSPEILRERMRAVLDTFPGINYGFTQPIDMRVSEMLTGVRAAVAVKLFGEKLELLERLSRQMESLIAGTDGAAGIFRTKLRGMEYMELHMDHAAMSRVGVSVDDINHLVRTAIGGEIVSGILEGNREVPILLRYPEKFRNSKTAVEKLTVQAADGQRVDIGNLVEVRNVDGPVQIDREHGKRMIVIQANVEGRDIVGFVDEVRRKLLKEVPLPAGYYVTFGGQFQNQQRASRRLTIVIPIALFLVFLILFSTLSSVRQAVLILLNIPFAFVGGILLLFASGLYLSVPASVGFIALLGIAVENGVVMVNHYNQLRRSGVDLRSAVIDGSARRLRPVLMTATLTMLGLVPLLLSTGPGSEIQRPLAVVAFGGTFTSTLLTLLLLPTMYDWIEGRAARRKRREAEEVA